MCISSASRGKSSRSARRTTTSAIRASSVGWRQGILVRRWSPTGAILAEQRQAAPGLVHGGVISAAVADGSVLCELDVVVGRDHGIYVVLVDHRRPVAVGHHRDVGAEPLGVNPEHVADLMLDVLRVACGETLVDGDEATWEEMTATWIVGVEHIARPRVLGCSLSRPRSVAADHEVLDSGGLGRSQTHADPVPLLLLLAAGLADGERHGSC